MLKTTTFFLAASCTILSAGCIADSGDESEDVSDTSAALSQTKLLFRRTVLARVYQHDQWTLPQADDYKPDVYPKVLDRRVHYVCDTLAPLRPTAVAGLIRLDGDEPLSDEQKYVFRGIRKCIRAKVSNAVAFEFVLNALHYTDPKEFPSKGAAVKAMKERIASVDAALAPDLWFFDFFAVPYNDNHDDWYREALDEGMAMIHARHHLVGGNVWGAKVPPGTDYAALDDHDRPDAKGIEFVLDEAKELRKRYPKLALVMHLENNPQHPDTNGVRWIDGTTEYRKNILAKHVSGQSAGYRYMFPVFFPLRIQGQKRIAYDARQDDTMLATIKHKLEKQ
jgi:hypothetical protein